MNRRIKRAVRAAMRRGEIVVLSQSKEYRGDAVTTTDYWETEGRLMPQRDGKGHGISGEFL